MADIIEKRYIRIEDWKGNVYYPQSAAGDSTAGSVIDASAASTDPTSGATTYTDGIQSSDTYANGGTCIILTSSSSERILFTTHVDNIPFGKVAVSFRVKSSIGSGNTKLMDVRCYYVDNTTESDPVLLSITPITANNVGVVNKWTDVALITDFKGVATGSVSIRIHITVAPGTGATISFDNISVAKALPGVTGTVTSFV